MGTSARISRWTLAVSTVAALLAGLLVAAPARAAVDVVLDGSTEARAAVSCWEIKQIKPSAQDGTYWLLTPQLKAPRQFYCDMTTDGGGWVLVGRGRDGWSWSYNGRGTSDQVAQTVTGTAAFNPRQLDSNVIDALLGGRRLDAISPELRVRRARDAAGTSWQEVVMTMSKAERWTWALGAGIPLSNVRMDGSTVSNSATTRDVNVDNSWRRIFMFESSSNNYVRGMNYGSSARGSNSASTYLYSTHANGNFATPFAQMFIRPKLRKADVTFDSVAPTGTAESTLTPVPNNGVKSQSWGVSGIGAGGTSENDGEVQAFAQVGDSMFVGGNFTQVQRGANATGADVVPQRYLAAFDVSTGAYRSSFQPPVLNSQVKALAALPGNRLAVGGEFTTVAGQPRAGLVVLDATTGAVDTTWTAQIENRISNGIVSIRALDVQDGYLYLGGAMTHVVDSTRTVYAKGGGRIQISNGNADRTWNPEFNGTVTALDVSTDGSRVYFAGYFTQSRGTTADRAAAFSTADGAARIEPVWQPTFSTAGPARYQQAIKEVGDKVWLGGSQHSMFAYDRTTFQLENAHVTKAGGDMQAIEEGDGVVYGGCHCEHYNLSDMVNYDGYNPGNVNAPWRFADSIYYLGVWEAATGDYLADFSPEMRARIGRGVWAIEVASDGTVWAGGTLESGVNESGSNQWTGGFARFGMRDVQAPDTPSNLDASVSGTDATVTWNGVGGADAYEVLRNDRVVATVTQTTAVVPDSTSGDRFFVRAIDQRGNRSASTAVVVADTAIATTTLLGSGATWQYYAGATAVPSTWATPRFDASGWASGASPLGWGSSFVTTTVPVAEDGRRPVVGYYRTAFTIPAAMRVGDVTVTVPADDGAAVYVNGTEIGRANLPTGALTRTTYATVAPRSAATTAAPTTFTIPQELLRQGQNTLAISSHVMYRSTPDGLVDATVVAEDGTFAPPVVTERTQLVKETASWKYLFSSTTEPPATWKTAAAGTGEWASGDAPLGWGTSGVITTNIDVPQGQTRGLTSYFRRTFQVTDPTAFATMTLTSRADDGVAIYINGVEVNRTRLPEGPLTSGTYATTAISTANALASPIVLQLPASLLQAGTNTIAVEVHSNYRSTPNQSMAVELYAQ